MSKACNVSLMLTGIHAIPRTCEQCGLGPCANYTPAQAMAAHREWGIGVSSEGPQIAPLLKPTKDEYFNPVRTEISTDADRQSVAQALRDECTCGAEPRKGCGQKQPVGYACTRTHGHSGPCAVIPAENDYTALRDTIGAVIASALEDLGKQVDATEIDDIAQSIIGMTRPDLIPVANAAPVKQTTMDGLKVHEFLYEFDRLQEMTGTAWWSAGRNANGFTSTDRLQQSKAVRRAREAMTKTEKEVSDGPQIIRVQPY